MEELGKNERVTEALGRAMSAKARSTTLRGR
jgi:hypothetical protein